MLTISKPSERRTGACVSRGRVRQLHARTTTPKATRFAGSGTEGLRSEWGLRGEVREEHFQRLTEGQHPITGEQLVRHQTAARIHERDAARK